MEDRNIELSPGAQAHTDMMHRGEPIKGGQKPSRNSLCPCKSGRLFKNCCYLKESPSKSVSPSESVFGFAMWLATLRTPVTFSARHDASMAAMAAGMFCEANGFPEPDMART